MEIRVLSDLHLEFNGRGLSRKDPAFELPVTDADRDRILVLAGDTDVDERAVDFPLRLAGRFRAIIQVLGNHEYYKGGSPQRLPQKLRQRVAGAGTGNVYVLENGSVDVGQVRFIGATLWTDFKRGDQDALREARNTMNDFHRIRHGTSTAPYIRRFLPESAYRLHIQSRTFIEDAILGAHADGVTPIVVTHHAPYLPAGSNGPPLSFSYGSDLTELIESTQPWLWAHGHTHDVMDTVLHGCRVVSNPRGYAGSEPAKGFDPSKVIQV